MSPAVRRAKRRWTCVSQEKYEGRGGGQAEEKILKYEERTMLGAAARGWAQPYARAPGLTKQPTGSKLRPRLFERDIQERIPRKGERERLDELLRYDRAESTDCGNVSNSRSRQGRQNA